MLGTGFADPCWLWRWGIAPGPPLSPASLWSALFCQQQNGDRITVKVREARRLEIFYLSSTIPKLFFCALIFFITSRLDQRFCTELLNTIEFAVLKCKNSTRDLVFSCLLLVTLQAVRPLVGQAEGRAQCHWATGNVGTGNIFPAAPGEVA